MGTYGLQQFLVIAVTKTDLVHPAQADNPHRQINNQ
jgi:hypothetical protein